jgi:hypothetical protein
MPAGTWAAAAVAPDPTQATTAATIGSARRHGLQTRSLLTSCTIHQETVL